MANRGQQYKLCSQPSLTSEPPSAPASPSSRRHASSGSSSPSASFPYTLTVDGKVAKEDSASVLAELRDAGEPKARSRCTSLRRSISKRGLLPLPRTYHAPMLIPPSPRRARSFTAPIGNEEARTTIREMSIELSRPASIDSVESDCARSSTDSAPSFLFGSTRRRKATM